MSERPGRDIVAARGAADAEIDAAGIERIEHAELLGDFERAVMRQHHAAAADPHPLGDAAEPRDEDFRRGPGEAFRGMMLGDPIAVIAEPVAKLRQLDRLGDRLGGRAAAADRRLIEDGKADHAASLAQPGAAREGHGTMVVKR